jgi:RAT1-interacting protein
LSKGEILYVFAETSERILTAPYEDRDGWDMNIMRVGGTLYLEEHLSEERLQEK